VRVESKSNGIPDMKHNRYEQHADCMTN